MNQKTDPFKEYLENSFENTTYTEVEKSSSLYQDIEDIIKSLNINPHPAEAAENGDKDSISLENIYLGEDSTAEENGVPAQHYAVVLCGGLNGAGKWTDYIKTLIAVFDILDEKYEDCWLIKLDSDCADDVYTAYIGLRPNQDKLEETACYNNIIKHSF